MTDERSTSVNDIYLTRRQAAERAEVDIRTIDRWLRTPGKLTSYRTVGREPIRVSQAELDALLAVKPVDEEHEHIWGVIPEEERDGIHNPERCLLCEAYKPLLRT